MRTWRGRCHGRPRTSDNRHAASALANLRTVTGLADLTTGEPEASTTSSAWDLRTLTTEELRQLETMVEKACATAISSASITLEFVVSDGHAGLKRAVRELLPEAVWQRCYVHFLRNALDYLPRKADDDCRQELRWLYDRRNLKEAQQDLEAWLTRWATRYPKLTDWVEAHIGETPCRASTTNI